MAVMNFGVCGVGACGFWRYRMPPIFFLVVVEVQTVTAT